MMDELVAILKDHNVKGRGIPTLISDPKDSSLTLCSPTEVRRCSD